MSGIKPNTHLSSHKRVIMEALIFARIFNEKSFGSKNGMATEGNVTRRF